MTFDLKRHLATQTNRIEVKLDQILSEKTLVGETTRPPQLLAAMRYGTLNGGKRIRPLMVIECAGLLGRTDEGVLAAACALELIHCYSLVHDDLPAMDDDDLRRGQPTVHKAFDEATGILAGDALLTLAFDVIAEDVVHPRAAVRLGLSRDLSRAVGVGGMTGGQMLDLQAEHRSRTVAEIRELQSMKTGALIRFACRSGAILANASEVDIDKLSRFGDAIGLAFQLADDLQDVVASPDEMGKATGKDAEAGKATLVGLLGVDRSRQELNRLAGEAVGLLDPYGTRAQTLNAPVEFIINRSSGLTHCPNTAGFR